MYLKNNFNEMLPILNFLASLKITSYYKKGTQVICFIKNNNIIKCYNINKSVIPGQYMDDILKQTEKINKYLLKSTFLFKHKEWCIYEQLKCEQFQSKNVILPFFIFLLKFIQDMYDNNIKIADIFYKNFGILNDKYYLFDYHNIETFSYNNNFIIENINKNFNILKENVKLDDIIINTYNTFIKNFNTNVNVNPLILIFS